MSWRCPCGTTNGEAYTGCEGCGRQRPAAPSMPKSYCPVDSAELDAAGFCPAGNGFPFTQPCRFRCQVCGGPLAWSGACLRCRGRRRPEDPEMHTGDCYEYWDREGVSTGHYRLVAKGPRPVLSAEDTKPYFEAIRSAMETGEQKRLETIRRRAGRVTR